MMHGIWVMAIITILMSVVIWGGLVYIISRKDWRYLLLLLPGLFLVPIVNLWIKAPLIRMVSRAGDVSGGLSDAPLWFVVFFAFVPPVTEELIKVIPLLIPPARRLVKRGIGAFSAGMALGIGFGLGEALYLAYNVSNNFMYLDIPWYQFSGYMFERFTTTFLHGVMTAVFVMGLARGGWRILAGFLGAVFLHLIINLPIILQIRGLLSPITISLIFQITLIAMAGVFALLYRQARRSSDIKGIEVEKTFYDRENPDVPGG
jgi:hypothetical protein